MKKIHEFYMKKAITLAKKALGLVNPNPPVGALIVKNGQIIGEGYHKKAGEPHAEVNAINSVLNKKLLKNSTIYVTLEPCNHHGKTPPCTEAIIEAGIKNIYIGALDPNRDVKGGGAEYLGSKGKNVYCGICQEKCRHLIAPFSKHKKTGLPWITLKVASSIDGKTATRTGESKWITNKKARNYGHYLRGISDAILVGKNTVIADDPSLTCRIKCEGTKNPIRIVLDSHLTLDLSYKIFNDENANKTIIFTGKSVENNKIKPFNQKGIEVFQLDTDDSGRIRVDVLMKKLGEMGFQRVLVEGGSNLIGSITDKLLFDECFFFIAPILIGGVMSLPSITGMGIGSITNAPRLRSVKTKKLGDNILIHGLYSDVDDYWI